MTDEEPKFEEGKDYDDWFQKNEELIYELARNDMHELLWAAWFAGYGNGLDYMSERGNVFRI